MQQPAASASQQQQLAASAIQQQQQQQSAIQHQQAIQQQQRQNAASAMQQQRHPAASAIQQQLAVQQQHLFAVLFGEFVTEARAAALESGTDMRILAVRRDGGALRPRGIVRDVRGIQAEERALQKLLARDLSSMRAAERANHAAWLRALRAAVVRELRAKAVEETQAADGDFKIVKVKREPEEDQEALAAGCSASKIRKVERCWPHYDPDGFFIEF